MSTMERTRIPAAAIARNDDSRPGPAPFTKTSASRIPSLFIVSFTTLSAAKRAAKGVLLREPLNPTTPALDQRSTLPSGSVTVTIVLLKVV